MCYAKWSMLQGSVLRYAPQGAQWGLLSWWESCTCVLSCSVLSTNMLVVAVAVSS